jgi:hypothetical protein
MCKEKESPKKLIEIATDFPSVWSNFYEMAFTTALGLFLLFDLNPDLLSALGIAAVKGGNLTTQENSEIRKIDERPKLADAEKTGRMRQNERRRKEAEARAKLDNNTSDLSKDRP